MTLALSQGVPWRVFTLDDPARLVLDFREVEWQGAGAGDLIDGQRALGLRLGQIRPGWSRMVVDLAGPHVLEEAGLRVDPQEWHGATLQLRLGAPDPQAFAAAGGRARSAGLGPARRRAEARGAAYGRRRASGGS